MPSLNLTAYAAGQPAARVDAALRQAVAACDRAQRSAVLWFAEVMRRELYRELGSASLEQYATEGLGFSRGRYWQFRRLAEDLERLPRLRQAVATGEIGWTKARHVARVATETTEADWVAKGKALGRRQLAAEVKKARDDGPAEILLAGLEALVVAGDSSRKKSTGPGVQIVVRQDPGGGDPAVVTSLGEKRLSPAEADALRCDARIQAPGRPNRTTIPPSVRAEVLARDGHRCRCGATRFLEIHHVVPRAEGGANRPDILITLCNRCHRFAHAEASAVRPPRAGTAAGAVPASPRTSGCRRHRRP